MRHEIREYTPADDAACKRLEVSASQFTVCGGLIKAAIVHKAAFDAKARQFPACARTYARPQTFTSNVNHHPPPRPLSTTSR